MCLLLDLCEEEGISKGSELKLISQVCKKLQKGKVPEEIAGELEEELETIERICEAAEESSLRYDENAIYEVLHTA